MVYYFTYDFSRLHSQNKFLGQSFLYNILISQEVCNVYGYTGWAKLSSMSW